MITMKTSTLCRCTVVIEKNHHHKSFTGNGKEFEVPLNTSDNQSCTERPSKKLRVTSSASVMQVQPICLDDDANDHSLMISTLIGGHGVLVAQAVIDDGWYDPLNPSRLGTRANSCQCATSISEKNPALRNADGTRPYCWAFHIRPAPHQYALGSGSAWANCLDFEQPHQQDMRSAGVHAKAALGLTRTLVTCHGHCFQALGNLRGV